MSQAKVLYIHITGVSSEVIKNLVLAGIRPAVCDVRKVDESKEFLSQTPSFFWAGQTFEENSDSDSSNKRTKYGTIGELVQPAIEDLNPLLGACELVNHSVSDLVANEEILRSFTVVVASRLTPSEALAISSKLIPGQKFFWVDSFGWHGSCWVDLGKSHVYRPEKGKELMDAKTLEPYVPLADMWEVPLHLAVNRFHKSTPPPSFLYHKLLLVYLEHKRRWPSVQKLGIDADEFVKYIREDWLAEFSPSLLDNDLCAEAELRKMAKQALCEIVPVCSVIGGMVGNEIIKAISGKGIPGNNTVFFDGTTCKGWHFLLKAKQK